MVEKLVELSRYYLKAYNRTYKRYFLRKHSLKGRFYIVTGQRGVGKTTALIQHMMDTYKPDSREVLYVPVDHTLVARYSLYEIAETFYKEEGVKLIFFDEIHKYNQWSRDLKSIYDVFPDLSLLASGSSAMEITKSSHDLSRRAIVYKMEGMSFREFIELSLDMQLPVFSLDDIISRHEEISHDIAGQVQAKEKRILPLFKDYLRFGYYPYYTEHLEILNEYYLKLEQEVRKTVLNDSLDVYPNLTGSSVNKILKLLSLLTASVPYTPDLNDLKRKLEIGDIRTLKQYLRFLQDTDILMNIYKKGRGFSELEKPGKVYLGNTNLVYALGNINQVNKGNIRETFFATIVSSFNKINSAGNGDFLVDDTYTFEIGGKNKDFRQLKGKDNAFLAVDDTEHGFKNKIPLWLFGFLY